MGRLGCVRSASTGSARSNRRETSSTATKHPPTPSSKNASWVSTRSTIQLKFMPKAESLPFHPELGRDLPVAA